MKKPEETKSCAIKRKLCFEAAMSHHGVCYHCWHCKDDFDHGFLFVVFGLNLPTSLTQSPLHNDCAPISLHPKIVLISSITDLPTFSFINKNTWPPCPIHPARNCAIWYIHRGSVTYVDSNHGSAARQRNVIDVTRVRSSLDHKRRKCGINATYEA